MLLQHPHVSYGHAAVHGFAHVVNGEQGDLHSCQGFHLYTGLSYGFYRGLGLFLALDGVFTV
jgi:hypothetical protein